MSPTRRALLRGALPVAFGLAGCSGSDEQAVARTRSRSGSLQDPPVSKPRNPEEDTVLIDSEDDSPVYGEVITDRSRIDQLEFEPGVPGDDVESARAFLEATDFSEETLYLTQRRIDSCERLRIQSLSWERREIEFEYCRELRPPDVRCVADRREALALVFRIPEVLDIDPQNYGSSGHSPCRDTDTDYERIDVGPNGTAEAE